MPKAYLIRCVLDTEEDVVRDILILENSRLSLMHKAIINAFGIAPGEMSSFFRSNDNWEQGEEISMMDFNPENGQNALDQNILNQHFAEKGDRMLYVYDFLNLWTFYLELVDIHEPDQEKAYPRLVGKLGEAPAEAPAKNLANGQGDEDITEDDEGLDEGQWY